MILTCRLEEAEKHFLDSKGYKLKFPCQIFNSNGQKLSECVDNITLSVVIPAYNEEKRLAPMMEECLLYLRERKNQDKNFNFELIIVNDGRYLFMIRYYLKCICIFCSFNIVRMTLIIMFYQNGSLKRTKKFEYLIYNKTVAKEVL